MHIERFFDLQHTIAEFIILNGSAFWFLSFPSPSSRLVRLFLLSMTQEITTLRFGRQIEEFLDKKQAYLQQVKIVCGVRLRDRVWGEIPLTTHLSRRERSFVHSQLLREAKTTNGETKDSSSVGSRRDACR
jgi:hypothetical protein